MTDRTLSSAAQAVLDAYNAGFIRPVAVHHKPRIAAALRAAESQLGYELLGVRTIDCSQLLLIAEELEGNKDFLKNYPEVTRVEVIANCSREFVQYDCSNVQVSLQDNGQTIKLFFSTSD
jgi:hypothetical protein